MPYTFKRSKKGINAYKRNGGVVHFHTKSIREAKRRARIRESYAHR